MSNSKVVLDADHLAFFSRIKWVNINPIPCGMVIPAVLQGCGLGFGSDIHPQSTPESQLEVSVSNYNRASMNS